MLKRREAILFLIVTVGILLLTLLQLNEISFLFGMGQVFLYFIFACTFSYAIYRFVRNKRKVSLVDKGKPLMLGIALIGFFFLLSYMVDTDGGKRRVMTGGFDHDLNFVYFQLFRDNQFKLLNSGPFGGTIHRGRYSLTNDTLRFNNEELRSLYPSLTFTLKRSAKNRRYFDPVDTTKSMYRLYVYKDFRRDR